MVRFINTSLIMSVVLLVLVCSVGLAFETCYRYTLSIQLIFILTSAYACVIGMCAIVSDLYISPLLFEKCMNYMHIKTAVKETISENVEEPTFTRQYLDLFHNQFEKDSKRIRNEQDKKNIQKFAQTIAYTRNTFIRLGFSEAEVYKICESVKYLVNNKAILHDEELYISYKTHVTQISLKNFAWNIANQHGISRDLAAEFVMRTFHEWFKNTTRTTVVKTLRTTLGTHDIEISEKLLLK